MADQLAHEVRPVEAAQEFATWCARFVQVLLGWKAGSGTDGYEGVIKAYARTLFWEYRVDFNHWWEDPSKIPPPVARLADLKWPSGSTAICQAIRRLQMQLEPLLTDLIRPGSVRDPFLTIRRAQLPPTSPVQTAIDLAAYLERETLQLRHELVSLRSELSAGTEQFPAPVKRPPDDAVRVFKLHTDYPELTQQQLADMYQNLTGIPMSQGKVSKWLECVKEWTDAGNDVPSVDPPPKRSSHPMDPAKLEQGPHLEGRPPRQRGKSNPE